MRSEKSFKALVDALPTGLIVADVEGVVRTANSEAERLFGFGTGEMLGISVERLLPERFRTSHVSLRAKFLAAPSKRSMGAGRDLHGVRVDGSEFPLEIGLQPITTDVGPMVIAVIVDTSERKRVQAELQETNRALNIKNRELEDFIHTVSHDLKSPMVTNTSYVQFLREDLEKQDFDAVHDSLGRIERSNQRMRQLINDLLNFNRVSRLDVNAQTFALQPMIQDLVADLRDRFDAAGVEVAIDASARIELHADTLRIQQALENLLVNALKYGCSNPRPRIVVGVEMVANEARIFVKDNGKGVSPEFHAKIFRLFERLEMDEQGTGLGLAIVSRIAEVHGGKAWIASSPGEGATFWFSLLQPPKNTPKG